MRVGKKTEEKTFDRRLYGGVYVGSFFEWRKTPERGGGEKCSIK
jgi:hypothetical protein